MLIRSPQTSTRPEAHINKSPKNQTHELNILKEKAREQATKRKRNCTTELIHIFLDWGNQSEACLLLILVLFPAWWAFLFYLLFPAFTADPRCNMLCVRGALIVNYAVRRQSSNFLLTLSNPLFSGIFGVADAECKGQWNVIKTRNI
jgi:hypothetical protein